MATTTTAPYPNAPFAKPYSSTTVLYQQHHHELSVERGAVDDYTGLSYFACLCCFWPLGLAAILKANKAQSDLDRGDLEKAYDNSREARIYALVSIAIGGCLIILCIVLAITIPLVKICTHII